MKAYLDLLESAWGIIANAMDLIPLESESGRQLPRWWREAAVEWRDRYMSQVRADRVAEANQLPPMLAHQVRLLVPPSSSVYRTRVATVDQVGKVPTFLGYLRSEQPPQGGELVAFDINMGLWIPAAELPADVDRIGADMAMHLTSLRDRYLASADHWEARAREFTGEQAERRRRHADWFRAKASALSLTIAARSGLPLPITA